MPKTVLIVEDDDHLRGIYAAAVTHRGYEVITATQGAEGVHIARTHRPEMILLDLRMPVMDGHLAMRYLRSFHETAGIPVCAISGFLPDYEPSDDDRLAFDAVLRKPVEPGDVVLEVEHWIGPPGLPRHA
jgi:CheY-like chemotaxis protein